MNATTKSLLAAGILGTVGFGTLAGAGIASAQTGTSNTNDPMSSLVESIASKFNLNKDEVQKVFDEQRTAHEAEREQQRAARLQTLVDDGTITAEQKSAIETKLTELKAERKADRSAFESMTDEQRKAKMDEKKTELESWAEEQGIDLTKIRGILGGPGGRGGHDGPPPAAN